MFREMSSKDKLRTRSMSNCRARASSRDRGGKHGSYMPITVSSITRGITKQSRHHKPRKGVPTIGGIFRVNDIEDIANNDLVQEVVPAVEGAEKERFTFIYGPKPEVHGGGYAPSDLPDDVIAHQMQNKEIFGTNDPPTHVVAWSKHSLKYHDPIVLMWPLPCENNDWIPSIAWYQCTDADLKSLAMLPGILSPDAIALVFAMAT